MEGRRQMGVTNSALGRRCDVEETLLYACAMCHAFGCTRQTTLLAIYHRLVLITRILSRESCFENYVYLSGETDRPTTRVVDQPNSDDV